MIDIKIIYDYCSCCREERYLIFCGEDVAYMDIYICYVCQEKIWIDRDEADSREVMD